MFTNSLVTEVQSIQTGTDHYISKPKTAVYIFIHVKRLKRERHLLCERLFSGRHPLYMGH